MNVPWFDDVVGETSSQKSREIHDRPKNFVCAVDEVCSHANFIRLDTLCTSAINK
jgi:hypothetical protein